ncbi:MAG: exo-alpha-sialidase [Candidatus Hydrogenedentes bacterium]|nr:exo-alpha-sialidase [Candidatus Hydrogenedentota bacterium]
MACLMAIVLMAAGAGDAAWPPDGALEWAWEYRGDALPWEAVPHWAGSPSGDTEAAVTPEGLRIEDRSSERGSLCTFRRAWRVDPAQGGVVEARIKVVANDSSSGAGIMLADGEHEAYLTLFPDRLEVNHGEVVQPFTTTDGFHVYRLAARQKDFLVWVDGALVIDGTGKFTDPAHANRSYAAFGSCSSAAKSDAVYAYVRYVPLGELPLPERLAGAEDVLVYKKPGVYACFPSLYRLDDGTLVASYGTRTRRSHIDSTGGSAASQSHDGGRTWEPVEGPRPMNPARRCKDGSLVAADGHGWRNVPAERRKEFEDQDITVRDVREGVVAYLQGAYCSRSEDGGQTWQKEELQLPAHRSLMTYNRVDAASLSEGLRLVSVYGQLKEDEHTRSFLLRSADDGKTWWFLPLAADPAGKLDLNETALAENARGEIVAMVRTHPPDGGYLFTTISTDRGITWAPARQTEIWGYPAHLLRLQDGRMLCSYGYRRDPMGVRAVISPDGGRTWNVAEEIILRCDGAGSGSDLGYPISIEIEPGRVFTIYYMTTDDGITHIAGTIWDIPAPAK